MTRNLQFVRVSYIIALSDCRQRTDDAQNVRADTVRRKDNDQQSLSKMIMVHMTSQRI